MLIKRSIAKPAQRLLRVYAFDPSRGGRLDNHSTISIPYEPLGKGPLGEKVVVIDYDVSNDCYYEAVSLDDPAVLIQDGLPPSEAEPWFHQQMVYAVVMDTLCRFEAALGREIRWRKQYSLGKRLRVLPHAMHEANAFYVPELRALLFGYFRASEEEAGANLPGQIVFTCLSHDIIVHETTHAILDAVGDYFNEPTSEDAAAFHEGFADIIALLQHFSLKDSLLDTIQRTGGMIHRRQLAPLARADRSGPSIEAEKLEDNPMVDLARQFGEAMGQRRALRSALGTRPDPRDLQNANEPHDRGAILVAAVFDAFFSVYIERTRDLVRTAYPSGISVIPNFLSADLANRLAKEAAKTAKRIQNICLRALDYCPPVDITFGDYLRALVTSDRNAVSDDSMGYRTALIQAFRARGIRPEGVYSYSEDALAWEPYEPADSKKGVDFAKLWKFLNQIEDDVEDERRQEIYTAFLKTAELAAGKEKQGRLGLEYGEDITVVSASPLLRQRPDGSLQRQIVVQLVQAQEVEVDERNQRGKFKFYNGSTLLINRQGDVEFCIKKGRTDARRDRQRKFLQRMAESSPMAPYVQFDFTKYLTFQNIHRGY